jgi:hypothetical protein
MALLELENLITGSMIRDFLSHATLDLGAAFIVVCSTRYEVREKSATYIGTQMLEGKRFFYLRLLHSLKSY